MQFWADWCWEKRKSSNKGSICRGFINVFSRAVTGFHMWTKLLELKFCTRKLYTRWPNQVALNETPALGNLCSRCIFWKVGMKWKDKCGKGEREFLPCFCFLSPPYPTPPYPTPPYPTPPYPALYTTRYFILEFSNLVSIINRGSYRRILMIND